MVTYRDTEIKNKAKNQDKSLVEKLIKNNDKSIIEEAKELKSLLINKNYENFDNGKNLIDNNLAVQGRKKYESSQHIQTDQQPASRNNSNQVDMMQLLQSSNPQPQTITKIEQKAENQGSDIIQGIKLDKLKGRYTQPTKISKEDMMMVEDSDEEQLFVTNAMDMDENKREFEEELLNHENDPKASKVEKELAGWGDWTGIGVKTPKNSEKPVQPQKRPNISYKKTNVIKNETLPKTFRKYMVADLPHEYKNKDQYNFEVGLALGSEWNGLKNSKGFCKPKVVNKAGEVITPLDTKHLPKAKFL